MRYGAFLMAIVVLFLVACKSTMPPPTTTGNQPPPVKYEQGPQAPSMGPRTFTPGLPISPIQHNPFTVTTNDPAVTVPVQQPVSITTTNQVALRAHGLISQTNSINGALNPAAIADLLGLVFDPTGVGDSTLAIQAALNRAVPGTFDELGLVPQGQVIRLPVGIFKISSTIVITNPCILEGTESVQYFGPVSGPKSGTRLIHANGFTNDLIWTRGYAFNGVGYNNYSSGIRNMALEGNGSDGSAIKIDTSGAAFGLLLEGLNIYGFGRHGIEITTNVIALAGTRILNVNITSCRGDGFHLQLNPNYTGGSAGFVLRDCLSQSCDGYGYWLKNMDFGVIDNCKENNSANGGMIMSSCASWSVNQVGTETCLGPGIWLDFVRNCVFTRPDSFLQNGPCYFLTNNTMGNVFLSLHSSHFPIAAGHIEVNGGGTITNIVIDAGGANYTNDTVVINGNGMNGAAHFLTTGGAVSSVVIDNGGTGYSTNLTSIYFNQAFLHFDIDIQADCYDNVFLMPWFVLPSSVLCNNDTNLFIGMHDALAPNIGFQAGKSGNGVVQVRNSNLWLDRSYGLMSSTLTGTNVSMLSMGGGGTVHLGDQLHPNSFGIAVENELFGDTTNNLVRIPGQPTWIADVTPQGLNAATPIVPNAPLVYIEGNGGAVTNIATPSINVPPIDGQELILQGAGNAVTLVSESILTGTKLRLIDTNLVINGGDIVRFIYNKGFWRQATPLSAAEN